MTQTAPAATRALPFTVRPVDYYYTSVRDELGAAYHVLSELAARGVDLLAFTAVPAGPTLVQFAIFPEDPRKLEAEARAAQLALDGPHHALLVQGDDELGALADVHERLFRVGIDIYASSGVTDARGSFGYVVYVREDQFARAVTAFAAGAEIEAPERRARRTRPAAEAEPESPAYEDAVFRHEP
jgi:hypothetical protein